MKIIGISAQEIYNSRGMPTLQCSIMLENGSHVSASVPTGLSRGEHEAIEMRDGGNRLMGLGVRKAVELIENTIAPRLIGMEPNLIRMDEMMIELDGTENKSKLGANTILAVSIAICRAQAASERCEPYELIASLMENESVSLPFPMFNVINGGMHASNDLQIQEFMIMPVGVSTFHAAMEVAVTFFQNLKQVLLQHGLSIAVGDEGGFAPEFKHETQALDCLMETIEQTKLPEGASIMFALDVAASHFYNKQANAYMWQSELISSDDLIAWYTELVTKYPIYAIEDGLSEHDWAGWQKLTSTLGQRIQIVGDDIFATNAELIYQSIEEHVANTILIKPNQVGTVTEALQAIKLADEYDRNVIVSHRSGETNDFFIADMAVGSNAGQIKAGGLSRGERLAKYNRLLEIENQLLSQVL